MGFGPNRLDWGLGKRLTCTVVLVALFRLLAATPAVDFDKEKLDRLLAGTPSEPSTSSPEAK